MRSTSSNRYIVANSSRNTQARSPNELSNEGPLQLLELNKVPLQLPELNKVVLQLPELNKVVLQLPELHDPTDGTVRGTGA